MRGKFKISALPAALALLLAAASCQTPTWVNSGFFVQPYSVAFAVPYTGVDPLPHLFAYVSDPGVDLIHILDVSLRAYPESRSKYFPLEISVGNRPTRLAVTKDQQRLYALNSVDRTISLVDTVLNVETGTEFWNGTAFYDRNPQTGVLNRIALPGTCNDIVTADSAALGRSFLYAAIENMNSFDTTGYLAVIETSLFLPAGTPNANVHKIVYMLPLPGVPGRLDVSPDGNTVYVSNRTSGTVTAFNVATQAVQTVSLGQTTEAVRYVNPRGQPQLLAISKSGPGLFRIDLSTMTPLRLQLSPSVTLPAMLPLSFKTIADPSSSRPAVVSTPEGLSISPATSLAGLTSTDPALGCPSSIGLVAMTDGLIAAIDTGGCMYVSAANSTTRTVAIQSGVSGLLVETASTDSRISMSSLFLPGSTTPVDYNTRMSNPGYPQIVNWNVSTQGFGFAISSLLAAYGDGAYLNVVFEGAIASGAGAFDAGAASFTDTAAQFSAAGVAAGTDWLLLVNPDGTPVTSCDDGTALAQSQFQITSVTQTTLGLSGALPPAGCFASPVLYQVRPIGMWAISITGYGLLGRIASTPAGVTFNYPSDATPPHLIFTIKDGTAANVRDTRFSSAISALTFVISPSMSVSGTTTALTMPTDIQSVPDSINTAEMWSFAVFSASNAMYQFSPRTLSTATQQVYQ